MPVGQDRRAVPNWLTVNTNSISAIAYPLRRRLTTTTTLLFPLTDANRQAAGVVVVAQQLSKEQKQQPEDEEQEAASGGNVALIPSDYERISPATLASHHHNSIDECDPDLLGFEIITG